MRTTRGWRTLSRRTGASTMAFGVLLGIVALGGSSAGQAPAVSAPDVQKLGPQVGATVPAFSLRDQTGRTQTLQSVMGPKGAILVFFRSADW